MINDAEMLNYILQSAEMGCRGIKHVRDGKYTAFWENGNIKTTGKYTNGLQDGTWIQYTEEGVQFLTTLFKDGKEIKWNNYTIK